MRSARAHAVYYVPGRVRCDQQRNTHSVRLTGSDKTKTGCPARVRLEPGRVEEKGGQAAAGMRFPRVAGKGRQGIIRRANLLLMWIMYHVLRTWVSSLWFVERFRSILIMGWSAPRVCNYFGGLWSSRAPYVVIKLLNMWSSRAPYVLIKVRVFD
jgi:hypothetical protein